MVATLFFAARVERTFVGGKDVLPNEFFGCAGVFGFEGIGKIDGSKTGSKVFLEKAKAWTRVMNEMFWDADRGGGTRQSIAWSIGAAGLLQWGAASYFGLRAFRKHAESNSNCHDNRCTPVGVEANEQAQRAADISTGLALTGLATVATSLYLLLTSPEEIHAAPNRSPTRFALGIWGTTIAADACF